MLREKLNLKKEYTQTLYIQNRREYQSFLFVSWAYLGSLWNVENAVCGFWLCPCGEAGITHGSLAGCLARDVLEMHWDVN